MILTITGPTCSGKSTLERKLVERGFSRVISTTTRAMRAGEENGKDYHFVSNETFHSMLLKDQLVEHVEFGGNKYGLSVNEVKRLLEIGKPIVVVCEPVGQAQIIKYAAGMGWKTHSVFVNVGADLFVDRFMGRISKELEECESHTPVLQSYSRRLKEVMTTERQWQLYAELGVQPYDTYLYNFTEKTEELQISTLLASLKEEGFNVTP